MSIINPHQESTKTVRPPYFRSFSNLISYICIHSFIYWFIDSFIQDTGQGLRQQTKSTKDWPAEFKEQFPSKRRFIPVNPTDMLNYERIEIAIIGSHEDPIAEFGETGSDFKVSTIKYQLSISFISIHLLTC